MTRTELQGVRRVLRLMDRYISSQKLDVLVTIDGHLWTRRELREHVRAALKVSKATR
jgi:hypothetical protein